MKILVLADNFTPEIVATSFRTHEHAKVWLEQGHEVTVVTCTPNWPRGEVFPGYKNRLYQEEWIDGIRVIRLWSYIAANQGFYRRTLDYLSYMASAIAFFWRYPKFDVVLATSPQFFTAVAGAVVSKLRRRPWIFELRDLWPESIRAVGASESRILKFFEWMEMALYRNADRVVALTNSFKSNLIERGIEADKIDVVPNGVIAENFDSSKVQFDARQRLGILEDRFLIGYVGTTGMAHGLETVLEAANQCRSNPTLHFLIMGQGANRVQLENIAREQGLTNITFADPVAHDEVASVYHALDLSLVHLRPSPLFRTVIPSKIFEAMAVGCPLLMAVEGEAAEIVRDAGCGICIRSGDAAELARSAEAAAATPERLARMGENGKHAAKTLHHRRTRALAVLDSLHQVVDGRSLNPGPATAEASSARSSTELPAETQKAA